MDEIRTPTTAALQNDLDAIHLKDNKEVSKLQQFILDQEKTIKSLQSQLKDENKPRKMWGKIASHVSIANYWKKNANSTSSISNNASLDLATYSMSLETPSTKQVVSKMHQQLSSLFSSASRVRLYYYCTEKSAFKSYDGKSFSDKASHSKLVTDVVQKKHPITLAENFHYKIDPLSGVVIKNVMAIPLIHKSSVFSVLEVFNYPSSSSSEDNNVKTMTIDKSYQKTAKTALDFAAQQELYQKKQTALTASVEFQKHNSTSTSALVKLFSSVYPNISSITLTKEEEAGINSMSLRVCESTIVNVNSTAKFTKSDEQFASAFLVPCLKSVIERMQNDDEEDEDDDEHQLIPDATAAFLAQYRKRGRATKSFNSSSPKTSNLRELSTMTLMSGYERRTNNSTNVVITTYDDLDPFVYATQELVSFALDIFISLDLCNAFEIKHRVMHKFLTRIGSQYNPNVPYHNINHGFATLQTTFMIIKPLDFLDQEDLLGILIAAFSHDVGHNGRTNDFHINTSSDLAMTYNDLSVQENMHASVCLVTLKSHGIHISLYVRRLIIACILATDMAKHHEMLSKLNNYSNNPASFPKELRITSILHAADIGNPTCKWEMSQKWSNALLKEFNAQFLEESEDSASVFMNAVIGSKEQAAMNVAFIDNCVSPLWKTLSDSSDYMKNCMKNIQINRKKWSDLCL